MEILVIGLIIFSVGTPFLIAAIMLFTSDYQQRKSRYVLSEEETIIPKIEFTKVLEEEPPSMRTPDPADINSDAGYPINLIFK